MKKSIHPTAFAAIVFAIAAAITRRSGWLLCCCLLAADARGAEWTATASLKAGRALHTSSLLPDGKVLLAGNLFDPFSRDAEIFDPATGRWSVTQIMGGRYLHTATTLQNGKLLLAGGEDNRGTSLNTAELYDPVTGTSAWTGILIRPRSGHTAISLKNGKVLVAGGVNGIDVWADAELYDPATGIWSSTGAMTEGRNHHTATLLPNGKVLVTGGGNASSTELYDPSTGLWTAAAPLAVSRGRHTATLLPNGKVLVAGGFGSFGQISGAELYDPAGNFWTSAGSLSVRRANHTATLLPDGKVCFTGGERANHLPNNTADIYDSVTGNWSITASLATARKDHSATLLPGGQLLVAGGNNGTGTAIASAEIYDARSGNWSSTGPLIRARTIFTATLMPDGRVLAAGGVNANSSELYDPATDTWSTAGNMSSMRYGHTATLLPDGKVLAAGGRDAAGVSIRAEIFDPATSQWTQTGSMLNARENHTATLLSGGKVLVSGGYNGASNVSGTEIYDPSTRAWTASGFLNSARRNHTATLLSDGRVLVAAGDNGANLFSAEIYNPATGVWTGTGSLASARSVHTASLLPRGEVLVAGGTDIPAASELYNPVTGTWRTTGISIAARRDASATLLPGGEVLVAGGLGGGGRHASAEVYQPATGRWTLVGSLAVARNAHTAVLLQTGKVLVAGGSGTGASLTSAELYDTRTGLPSAWKPIILSSIVRTDNRLSIAGLNFRSPAGGSSGNGLRDSSTSFPLVQIRRLDNGECHFLPHYAAAGNSDTSVVTEPIPITAAGHVLVTIFTGGIPSASSIMNLPGSASIRVEAPAGTPLVHGGTFSMPSTLVNFPSVSIFTILNQGIAPLNIADVTLTGPDAGSFSMLSGPASPVQPGGSASFTIVFQPSSRGLKTATLRIGSNAAGRNPWQIALTGSILESSIELRHPSGEVIPNGGGMSFDAVSAGAAINHTFTVANPGGLELTGVSVTKDGTQPADFTVTSQPASVVAAGGTTSFTVRFSAATAGIKSAVLHITSNAPGNSPYDIVLNGVAAAGLPFAAASPMGAEPRDSHTATLLPDGRVLVAGGSQDGGETFSSMEALSSAEIYDPATGIWSSTASMSIKRARHTATMLPNGKVLVVGGFSTGAIGPSLPTRAELYDPTAGTWSNTGSLIKGRYFHTATLLQNGKVLVTGGFGMIEPFGVEIHGNAELYDPATGQWSSAGSPDKRSRHTAALLPDGRVLVTGGVSQAVILGFEVTAGVQIYNPANNGWSPAASLALARCAHCATRLPDGKVLITGGGNNTTTLLIAEIYNPVTGTWNLNFMSGTLFMQPGGLDHTATLLPNGKVLVAGGRMAEGLSSMSNIYDPNTGSWAPALPLLKHRWLHTATLLPGGTVLFAGGASSWDVDSYERAYTTPTAEIYGAVNASPAAISVEQPAGTTLPNGDSRDFGTVQVNSAVSRVFTVRNPGGHDLTGLAITVSGTDAADFRIIAQPSSTVLPGQFANFTVLFNPVSAGSKSASLQIANSVPGYNPYDVFLSGIAPAPLTPRESWRQQYFGQTGNSGIAADTADPDGDGHDNDFEFIAGLVPTDRDSRFNLRVEPVPGLTGPKRIIFSPVIAGRTYVVKAVSPSVETSWSPLSFSVSTDSGTERTVTEFGTGDRPRFYRVEITDTSSP